MKRLILLLTVISSLFILPSIANAGCVAEAIPPTAATWSNAGTPNHSDDTMYWYLSTIGAYCPNANTNLYHINMYAQQLISGTWQEPAALYTYYQQPMSETFRNTVSGKHWNYNTEPIRLYAIDFKEWLCRLYSQPATSTRMRIVVVNEDTGSTNTTYTQSATMKCTCY